MLLLFLGRIGVFNIYFLFLKMPSFKLSLDPHMLMRLFGCV